MTHPGHPDAALQAMRTRLRQSREHEVRLLCSPRIRRVFEDAGVPLYGELHRFIPALAGSFGARIAEVPISNVPRPNNVSHYGLARTWRVMADLITVRFLLRYVTRPLHFFGPIGFGSLAVGGFARFYVLARKLLTGDPIFLEHGPLLLLSAMLIQAGVVLIGLGLLAEILTRVYVDGRRRRIYTVERVVPSPRMSIATPHARAR
jgi:hypothetical protein